MLTDIRYQKIIQRISVKREWSNDLIINTIDTQHGELILPFNYPELRGRYFSFMALRITLESIDTSGSATNTKIISICRCYLKTIQQNIVKRYVMKRMRGRIRSCERWLCEGLEDYMNAQKFQILHWIRMAEN